MTSLNTFNQAPYYDDFDENKKFYKILFRPGYAVQVRELNQLQTMIQKQIQRHGDNIFKEGAMVVPGQVSVDTDYYYVKLQPTYNNRVSATFIDQLVGKTVVGASSGVKANVVNYVLNLNGQPDAIFVKYLNSGTSQSEKSFFNNEVIAPVDNAFSTLAVISQATNATGSGSAAAVARGVYYIGGNFVLVTPQTIILDSFGNLPSYRVGLKIIQTIVSSQDDETLLDNAQGTYNFSAPGADRYQLDFVFSKLAQGSTDDSNFVQLLSVQNGTVQTKVETTEYNVVEKTLARRTYDEAGDYTVRPFSLDIREHRNNNRSVFAASKTYQIGDVIQVGTIFYVAKTAGVSGATAPSHTSGDAANGSLIFTYNQNPFFNRGIYLPEQGGDATKLAFGLESGKAYVRGYEVNKIATEYLAVPKARDSAYVQNQNITATIGNFIYVTNLNSIPAIEQYQTVNLYDQLTATIGVPSGNLIGTARVRGIEFNSGTQGSNTAFYKLQLFAVSMIAGKDFAKDVKQLYIAGGTATTSFSADIRPYTSQKVGSVLSAGTTTVTGSGTLFLSDLRVGDYVQLGSGGTRRVTAIASNTSFTVDSIVTVTNEAYFVIFNRLFEPNNSSLIFPLPFYATQSVRSADGTIGSSYVVSQRFSASASVASGATCTLTLAVTGGNDTFASELILNNYLLVDTTTGLSVAPISAARNNPLNTQITFTLPSAVASHTFTIVASVNKNGLGTEKTKTLQTTTMTVATQVAATTNKILLNQADGYLLLSVMMDTGTFAAPTGIYTVNISNRYTFFDGQNDSFYDVASVSLRNGVPSPTAPIQITYQYFSHSGTGDYFTVNSYTSSIAYEQIPNYKTIQLRDVIDFRPRIDNTGTDFSSTGSSYSLLPKRGNDIQINFSYYLSRIDKVAVDITGKFFVVSGVSALNPSEPNDPSNSMVIYKASIEPYTLSASNTSVVVTAIDNKRYTMRDIGKLEKRIDNLEYYTSLSLLEQDTKNMKITDSNNLDRFKNGFIVDSFNGHGVGNSSSPDYLCSIDMENGVLMPFFTMNNVAMVEKFSSNSDRATAGYQITGDLITLPYTEQVIVNQPYASHAENVNPFAIFTFLGSVDLNPSSDDWFETDRRPDIVTNVEGNFSTIQSIAEQAGVLGTVWNSWQTQWTGATYVADVRKEVLAPFSQVQTQFINSQTGFWRNRATFSAQDRTLVGGTDTLGGNGGGRVLTYETTATQSGQSRSGIKTSVVSKVDTRQVDDRVISRAVIPFIRSRNILFLTRGLKPSTVFHPYFEDVDISQYVTPATKIAFTPVTSFAASFDNTTNVGGSKELIYRQIANDSQSCLNRGDVVYVQSRGATVYTVDNSPATAVVVLQENSAVTGKAIYVVNVKGTFQLNDIVVGTISNSRVTVSNTVTPSVSGQALSTNFNGDVAGIFLIPNNTAVRFRTGTREFKLTDSTTNGIDFSSQAKAAYEATGTIESKQASVIATRNGTLLREQVADQRTITVSNTERLVGDTGWYDPLAQTFLIQQPGGAFLTHIDIFFKTKDDNVPVQLEVREVVNGYPGKVVLPFSHVLKTPDQITVSNDGSIATSFTFPSPIYVNDATEYCVVVMSDSPNYLVWVSQLGEKVAGTDRFISEQPYAGVLFKSQNASTWTADQLQDLKFAIYRAKFTTNSYGEVEFVNDLTTLDILGTNPIQTTAGSKVVRVLHRDHGMSVGSKVILYNSTDVNGIPASEINTTQIITAVGLDSYVFSVATTNAIVSGFAGGSAMQATRNVQYETVQPSVQAKSFPDTSLQFFMRTTTGKSVDGVETPYQLDATYQPVTANESNRLKHTCIVASKVNASSFMSVDPSIGQKTASLKARLFSINDSVSPIIDTHRVSLIAISNKVNKPTSATRNISPIDDRIVVSASTVISFAGSTITTADAATRLAFKTISVGRYIVIAGSASNNREILVTSVASDGSSITVNGTLVTEPVGNAVTLTARERFVEEIAPVGSSSHSKYVSKKVNLANVSTYIKIRLSANVPANSSFSVYYKTNQTGASTSFDSINYTLASSDAPIITGTNESFTDIDFSLPNLIPFDAVQVKIVLNSTDASSVPKIKDLQIIACA